MPIEIIVGGIALTLATAAWMYFIGRQDGKEATRCLYIAEQQNRVIAEKNVVVLRAKNQILEEEILKQQKQIALMRQGVEIA